MATHEIRRRSRPAVTVEEIAAGLDAESVAMIAAAHDGASLRAESEGIARWHREITAALVEHLAERENDPLWMWRFPLLDLPPG